MRSANNQALRSGPARTIYRVPLDSAVCKICCCCGVVLRSFAQSLQVYWVVRVCCFQMLMFFFVDHLLPFSGCHVMRYVFIK